MRTSVLLVDDHQVTRTGLRAIIGLSDDLEVCGEAATASQALDLSDRLEPDVAVVDLMLGGESGVDLTAALLERRPELRVLVLTAYDDEDVLFAAIAAGATGFMLKAAMNDELLVAIRAVAAGKSLLDPSVTGSVLDRLRQGKALLKDERLRRLTPREEEILALLADGRTNQGIATTCHLSEKTVKNHLTSIFEKLGTTSRTEAAAYYLKRATRLP